MRTLPVALVLLTAALTAPVYAAIEPASILSPRPAGWVVDLARVLSPEQTVELNRLGDAVHGRDGAELAIVTVPTTAGAEHRDFATRLFNHWAIGDRVRNNGVLILVAVEDRAAEIILGRGIDSDADVAMSDRVMRDIMVPRFRQGDNAGAILAGAQACAREFFEVGPPDASFTAVEGTSYQSESPSRRRGGLAVPGGPAGLVGAGGMGVAAWVGIRAWLRRRPRRCGRCSMTMERLNETADDAHLAPSERTEERLGSVDYDVWLCPGCGAAEKSRYGRWTTRYSRCPQCNAVTTSKARSVLVRATTMTTGLVEIHEHCESCGFDRVSRQTTPRVSPSSARSSGRSSSGFGGGGSSGRGSSGRW